MPKPYIPPTGRIPTKARKFEEVVRDIRHAVYAVLRLRPTGEGNKHEFTPLGSGFFVSPEIFLTCNHVMNGNAAHVDGDTYQLLANTSDNGGFFRNIPNVHVGQNLHLFPDCDLALLKCPVVPQQPQPFVALEYGDIPRGREIGVAGYPVPTLRSENDEIKYDGVLYRIARGVVTSRYTTSIQPDTGGLPIVNIPIVEVNFLFVNGNSGGPVFDVETGRVFGFVHGYSAKKLKEAVKETTLIKDLPDGMSNRYIENLDAIYSLAIKLDRVKPYLEQHGVTL
jgi:trypsin-like peptidase